MSEHHLISFCFALSTTGREFSNRAFFTIAPKTHRSRGAVVVTGSLQCK